MEEGNWKHTIYIWDGIVTQGIPEVDEKEGAAVPLQWEGSWVPVKGVPDAADAEAPKRHAFKKDIDADCKFLVTGTAASLEIEIEIETNGKNEGNNDERKNEEDGETRFFVAKLTEGEGWEMQDGTKKSRYHDTIHDVWVKSLKWSGNQKDQRESLIVAKGKNEFGPFVSVGWIRPGCRWTLARRYLSDEDPRASWSIREFYDAVVHESITVVEGSDEKILRVPPWQTAVMHADYQDPAKRKPDKEDDTAGGKRQKMSAK